MSTHGRKVLYRTKVTDVKTSAEGDAEGVGTIRWEGEKCYRWVMNYETGSLTAGMPVCYEIGLATAFYEAVHTPTTANLNTFAGICMGAIATKGFGWIQIEGYHGSISVLATNTTQAAGLICYPLNTKSYLQSLQALSAVVSMVAASVSNTTIAQTATAALSAIGVAPRVQLAASITTGDAASTIGGFIHCLTV
jgi:hypothetical protein